MTDKPNNSFDPARKTSLEVLESTSKTRKAQKVNLNLIFVMRRLLQIALVGLALIGLTRAAWAIDPENTIYLDLKDGRVVIELLPEVAPEHVKRIKTLTREGFYNGIIFHRVIEGFMAQTGDPTGTGMGGSSLPDLKEEFNDEVFWEGTLGMARSNDPNSANSQFFICLDAADFLDGKYTLFGRVVEGMEFVHNIAKGEPPAAPDKIIKMQVASDVDKKQ
jgi:peptidylprolyl isomerase